MDFEEVLRQAWTEGAAFDVKLQRIICSCQNVRVGQVAHCHMIVEHFLLEFLVEARLCTEKNRPTYSDKINMAMYPNSPVKVMGDGLRALGTIRNSYVHNLDYKPEARILDRLRACVRPIYEKTGRIFGPEDFMVAGDDRIIEQYTLAASAQISAVAHGMAQGRVARPKNR